METGFQEHFQNYSLYCMSIFRIACRCALYQYR